MADDGRGVSRETLLEARSAGSLADVVTQAGFSTAGEVTELSGRGVGLDVVRADQNAANARDQDRIAIQLEALYLFVAQERDAMESQEPSECRALVLRDRA